MVLVIMIREQGVIINSAQLGMNCIRAVHGLQGLDLILAR